METQISKNVLNVIQTSGNVRHDVLNVWEVSQGQAMATCVAKQQSFQDPSHSNLQSLGVQARGVVRAQAPLRSWCGEIMRHVVTASCRSLCVGCFTKIVAM